MISKESMYNIGKKKALEGAFIEKYYYSMEKGLLFDTNTMLYPGNTRVTREPQSIDNTYIEDIDMYLKREDNEDVLLSSSKISIVDSKEQSLHVPFKEVKEEPKIMSFKDKVAEKFDCTVLYFYITTGVKSVQDDTHSTIRTYSDMFKVAVDRECYVYIVQCADGTLPIILVSKTLVEDIEDLIFEGNIKDGIFNSYFHPHNYQKQQIETIQNVVYGKPYDGFNKLEFSEEIVGDEYITNDKLKCRKDGPVRIVSLDGYDFATYRKDETDMESIDFIKFIKSKDIFNPLNEIEKTVSYDYLLDNYQVISKISNMIPVLPIENISEDERFDIICQDDPDKFIVRFEDYSNDNFFNLIINIIDDGMCEIYYNIDDREFYMIYYNGYSVTMSIKEDQEGTVVYNGSPRRIINQSRDCTLYTYKENYWINCDHSGHIINTNLPIEGTMEKYNMFGVPESF